MEQFSNMIAFKIVFTQTMLTVCKIKLAYYVKISINVEFPLHIYVTLHVPIMDLFSKDTLCTLENIM